MLRPLRIHIDDYSFLMLPIEGGSFAMGDEVGDLWSACQPVHGVEVPSFYLAQHQLTQQLWEKIMGENLRPAYFKEKKRPMESVSWDDAQEFIQKLKQQTPYTFRLPTEAEWEYAARGGRFSLGCDYAGSNRVKEVAWYHKNSHNETKIAGQKYPNELGLYDMSGNVWEWCEDDWHSNYDHAPDDGSAWIDAKRGSLRVFRGGAWVDGSQGCRSASRLDWNPDYRGGHLGFRLALSLQSVGQPSASL